MSSFYTLCMVIPLVFQILLYLASHTTAQPNFLSHVCQDTFGNYTSNSTFKKNLDILLSTITSNTNINYGFYNFSVGQSFDVVNGIGLCRADISVDDCHTCLQQGAAAIVEKCPYQKDAIGWYDNCMIRYSDRYIFGKMELGPWYTLNSSVLFGIGKAKFNQTASILLAKLQVEAASGDSRRKYGAGTANVTSSSTLYALVQCTPDLEYFDCYNCLDNAISFALTEFYGQQARVIFTSCGIRYEAYPFYNSTNLIALERSLSSPPASASPPPSTTLDSKGRTSKKLKVLIVILPIIASLLLLVILFGCYFMRRRRKALKQIESGNEIMKNQESLEIDFNTIKTATGNFSEDNKLGQGGFGTVYKGKLPNGQEIAVKRLSMISGQGEEEFKNEALLVAKLRHRNLVRFLGFCLEGEERLLIYELLPNKSLDYFLFDPIKRVQLDWQTRYNIIGGIARGLLYLHEDSQLLVVHRDLKAGNILLDSEMNPKISDFGMARLFGVDQTRAKTSRICGTYGYMSPEYVQHGHFSVKSDVFSFGVLLLEIVSGQRINSFYNSQTGESLLSYAWRNWLENTTLNIVDSAMPIVDKTEVLRCINIGLLCVQENLAHRPIMSSVVLMLNNQTISLPVPSRPAFLLHNDEESDQSEAPTLKDEVHIASSEESKNEVSISEFDPR